MFLIDDVSLTILEFMFVQMCQFKPPCNNHCTSTLKEFAVLVEAYITYTQSTLQSVYDVSMSRYLLALHIDMK